jgi:putative aminopeptidase FrvX
MKGIAELLTEFSDAHGLSGYEDEVASLLREEMEPLVDEVRTDGMGNVIGIRSGDSPAVMVAAHMDEIGLMVSHIDDDGYLRVVSVGGWFDQTILSQRVMIHTRDGKRIPGVVGSRPPHLMDADERKKMVKLKDMFVDCGATSATNATDMGVEIGAPITIDRELRRMGNDFVTGKALDNRAGVVMMVAALQRLKGEKVHRAGGSRAEGSPHQRLRPRSGRRFGHGRDHTGRSPRRDQERSSRRRRQRSHDNHPRRWRPRRDRPASRPSLVEGIG